ncbi:hypothetical protein Tco_0828606, partial [Tanacetum coccineum]
MWQQWRTAYPEAYETITGMAEDSQNITSHVRTVIMMEDPYRGSTERQDIAQRDLDRLTCEDTKDLWRFMHEFRILAINSGKLYFPSTTEKYFSKLPPILSQRVHEAFKRKYPGLIAGVLPAIKFTHTFVSEMCKEAALSKELRDLSFCSAVPIPGYYKNNKKRYLQAIGREENISMVMKKTKRKNRIEEKISRRLETSKELPEKKQKISTQDCKENPVTWRTNVCSSLWKFRLTERSRLHCPKCCLTSCANCANYYLKIKMTVKKAEPEKKNVPTTGTSGDGTIIGMLKAKDDEIKQMIKDQAKEYYENIQKEKAWEQKLSEEKQKVKELQKTRDDQERRISWIHEENIRLKQQQEWGKEQLIKEFEQKIEEARINEKEALKERISHLEERIKGYEEERFEREFPSLGRNANLLIALEEQMDEPRIKEHVANVILEMEVIKNTEVGQDSSRSKTRKVVNHLYNVTVEFDIPNCPFFKTKAIIDTGASSCVINKEVVPEEALELFTNFINVNGLNSSQPAKHKIKGGMFAIEGNKFR